MSTDIATQDIFKVVLARPVTTEAGEHPALVHLWWSAPQQGDRLVQVYLDGELIDVTTDPTQREMWLMIDRGRPHRIELLAVPADEPDQLWCRRPDRLASWNPGVQSAATVALVRDEQLPVDTQVTVSVDGEALDRGPMWPADETRSGFGALFGLNGFGHDAITGPGLGRGELGMGPLGTDGTAWRWQRGDLQTGSHDLLVTGTDAGGQTIADPVSIEGVLIDQLPPPPDTFTINSDFTLAWTA